MSESHLRSSGTPQAFYDEGELHIRLDRQSAITEISQCALRGMLPDALFRVALERVARLLKADYSLIEEWIPDEQVLAYRAGTGWRAGFRGFEAPVVPGISRTMTGYSFLQNTSIVVSDFATDPRFAETVLYREYGIAHGLSVVVHGDQDSFGVLSFYGCPGQPFTTRDVEFVQSVADVLGIALVRRKQEDAVHRRSEVQLQESEYRYQAIFEQASIGMARVGLNGSWQEFNNRLLTILGYRADELRSKTFQEVIHQDDAGEYPVYIAQLLAGAIADYRMEKRYFRKDGILVWCRLTVSVHRSREGRPLYFIWVIEDVTDHKLAEEGLRESESQLHQLVDNLTEGLVIFDDSGPRFNWKPVSLSEQVFDLPGGRKPMLEEFGEFFELITLSGEVLPIGQWPHVRILAGECLVNVDLEIHRFGSDWRRCFRYNGGSFTDAAGKVLFYMTITDITEQKNAEQDLKRSEKIYRTIASSIPGTLVCIFDAAYRYILIEGELINRLGYKPAILLGRAAREVLPADIFERLSSNLELAFAGRLISLEHTMNGIDLVTRYIPLPDGEKGTAMVMVASLDVTGIKDAQRKISLMNEELEQRVEERTGQLVTANKEMDAFNYTVAHDLRAPLRAINSYAKILSEEFGPGLGDEGDRICQILNVQSRRMGQLIDDLLAFSRLNRIQPAFYEIDMEALANEVFETLTTESDRLRIDFSVSRLPRVSGDATLMRQVWQNLIGNAIKFSQKRDRGRIVIDVLHDDGEVVYRIRDNGAGFEMKYVDKIFGIFQRLHKASEFEGTGVGLAIVARIIQLHGGRIWAESQLNEGATFFFTCHADAKRMGASVVDNLM